MTLEELEGRIINADCMDILRELPDKSVDLVLTDPPYGIGADKMLAKKSGRKEGKSKAICTFCEDKGWDKSIPPRAVFDEIFRVSQNQIIFGGNYFAEYLPNSPCWLVWDKLNGTTDFADAELAYTSFKSPVRIYKFLWNGMLQQNMAKKEKRIHPTQKPVDLFGQILRDCSEDGALILDPFSGSGTTALAARILKRRFICIEKDAEYWRASVERLEEAKKQGELF